MFLPDVTLAVFALALASGFHIRKEGNPLVRYLFWRRFKKEEAERLSLSDRMWRIQLNIAKNLLYAGRHSKKDSSQSVRVILCRIMLEVYLEPGKYYMLKPALELSQLRLSMDYRPVTQRLQPLNLVQ